MTLGMKIACGFGSLVVICVGLGGFGYYNAARNGESISELGATCLPSDQALQTIGRDGERIKTAQRSLLCLNLTPETIKQQFDSIAQARESYAAAWKQYETLPRSAQDDALWKELGSAWQEWRKANTELFGLLEEIYKRDLGDPRALRGCMEQFRGDHYKLILATLEAIRDKKPLASGTDHTQCSFGKWKAAYKTSNPELIARIQECEEPHRQFHESTKKINELIQKGNIDQAMAVHTTEQDSAADKVLGVLERMNKVATDAETLAAQANSLAMTTVQDRQTKANELLGKLIQMNSEDGKKAAQQAIQHASLAESLSLGMIGIAVSLGVVLAWLITRSIIKSINRIAEALSAGAEQTAIASTQVSSASQSLAQGASEQAASLEETSSSLEEMSSMTKKNAETAQQAASLSAEAKKAADQGNAAMGKMSDAIQEIQKSASETAKIIKVIDEIAFQTNLLALNAAVEAARAGEAGKGFAVVAEEVRNLAMRSAEAAKNTSALIEESVNNAKNGVSISTEVAQMLAEITNSNAKVNSLVGEIAAASGEQAQGIEQVNTAVGQMDKVTQSNAANAEESASAAEELSAQAEQLTGVVGELLALVNGTTIHRAVSPNPSPSSHQPSVKLSATKPKAHNLIPLDSDPATDKEAAFSDFNQAA